MEISVLKQASHKVTGLMTLVKKVVKNWRSNFAQENL